MRLLLRIPRNTLSSGDDMKVLGFNFSSEPTVTRHVEAICRRFRQKYRVLIHLRNFGFNEEELAKVYKSIVRPVANYCPVVYHPMLTDRLDEQLDQCQLHPHRCIYRPGVSYAEMRRRAGISTLRQRRIDQSDKFVATCAKSSRFTYWFPAKTVRSSVRSKEPYLEQFARCKRLQDSPLFFMRRRLNGKAGKVYGERNRARREDGYVGGTTRVPGKPGRQHRDFLGNLLVVGAWGRRHRFLGPYF